MSFVGKQKYINWDAIYAETPELRDLFSDETLTYCQQQITQKLKGVHHEGRDIIVTKRSISNLLFSVYDDKIHNQRKVGDIYSRHIQPNELHRTDLQDIVQQTINIIVNDTRIEYETIRNNQKMTVWNTMYGDFNQEGLRAHSKIKTREKRVPSLQFHMNY